MRPSRLGAALVLVLASPAWSQERAVQDAPHIVGTWKLNLDKSTVRVPPGAMEIRQYNLRPDGFLVGLLISSNARDYHYLQFVAKSDGRDYPEYSDQIVGDLVATGSPTRRTYAEKTIDEYVTEWIDKVDGRITAQGKKIVSKDRQTLTITVDGVSQVRVYDRLSVLSAQTPVGGPPKVDVSTIHRNKDVEGARAAAPPGAPIPPARMMVLPGGRLIATGISTMELIREGYGYVLRPASDVTGPGWLDVDRFDLVIKGDRTDFGPPQPAGLLPLDAQALVRAFLADRFKLSVRRETKNRDIYELRVARSDRKLGPGLTPADGSCAGVYDPPGPQPRCPFVLGGGRGFQTGHITMADLAMFFGVFPAVNTTVVDKTELAGAFDVTMSAFVGGGVANAGPDDTRPQMFTAVQDMLGLKLERVKGQVEVIVVDRVERPTEN
jgi:uncharacterized protein (TIGR03435 family)